MYAVYDMKNKEQCVGIFDCRKDAATYLNIHQDSLSRNIQKNRLVKNQYKIVNLGDLK